MAQRDGIITTKMAISLRRKSAGTLLSLARALEFFAPALITAEDLIATNEERYHREGEVETWIRVAPDGFSPEEAQLVPPFPGPGAQAVVLGCGGGREAIALARAGWQVRGIDMIPTLIASAKKTSSELGLSIEWVCQNLARGIHLDRPADLICLLNIVYSYIPTRKRRVALLAECRRIIRPEGHCILHFAMEAPRSPRRRWAQPLRVLLATLVGGNRELEAGDYWYEGRDYQHNFSSMEEFSSEARQAGWKLSQFEKGWPSGSAVLVPDSAAAPVDKTEGIPPLLASTFSR
jgi:SAM-dependent methyltransferase